MKQVWKCDFCSTTSVSSEVITQHEPKCSFNKANKHCYTCKYHYEQGYYGEHIPGCEIDKDVLEGEDNGNCPYWVWENLDEDRDKKIEQVLKP